MIRRLVLVVIVFCAFGLNQISLAQTQIATALAEFVFKAAIKKLPNIAYGAKNWFQKQAQIDDEEQKSLWTVSRALGIDKKLESQVFPDVQKAIEITKAGGGLISVNIATAEDGTAPVLIDIQFLGVAPDPLSGIQRAIEPGAPVKLQLQGIENTTFTKRSYFIWISRGADGQFAITEPIKREVLLSKVALIASFSELIKGQIVATNLSQFFNVVNAAAYDQFNEENRKKTADAIESYKKAELAANEAESAAKRAADTAEKIAAIATDMKVYANLLSFQMAQAQAMESLAKLEDSVRQNAAKATDSIDLIKAIKDGLHDATGNSKIKTDLAVEVRKTAIQRGNDLLVFTDGYFSSNTIYKDSRLYDKRKVEAKLKGN